MTPFTEEQLMIVETASKLADDVLVPDAGAVDRESRFPQDAFAQMAELGFCALPLSEASGGLELGDLTTCLALEEIARGCGSTARSLQAHAMGCARAIDRLGDDEQRASHVASLATGEQVGAFASGGSVTAAPSGDGWTLTGHVPLVANVMVARVLIVDAADTEGTPCLFLAPRDAGGLTVGETGQLLGLRGSGCAELRLADVAVGTQARLGDAVGRESALAAARVGLAAVAVGLARDAHERAARYAQERVAFGKSLSRQEAVQQKLANMAIRIEAARELTHRAARALDDGAGGVPRIAAIAKILASEAATFCGDEAIQIHGGYGYVSEYHVERLYRDGKVCEVADGTNEECRRLVSRFVLAS